MNGLANVVLHVCHSIEGRNLVQELVHDAEFQPRRVVDEGNLNGRKEKVDCVDSISTIILECHANGDNGECYSTGLGGLIEQLHEEFGVRNEHILASCCFHGKC